MFLDAIYPHWAKFRVQGRGKASFVDEEITVRLRNPPGPGWDQKHAEGRAVATAKRRHEMNTWATRKFFTVTLLGTSA